MCTTLCSVYADVMLLAALASAQGRSTANRKDEHVPLLSSSDGTDGGT
jgi:hypothetical protein